VSYYLKYVCIYTYTHYDTKQATRLVTFCWTYQMKQSGQLGRQTWPCNQYYSHSSGTAAEPLPKDKKKHPFTTSYILNKSKLNFYPKFGNGISLYQIYRLCHHDLVARALYIETGCVSSGALNLLKLGGTFILIINSQATRIVS
jgi:hypothetical protein